MTTLGGSSSDDAPTETRLRAIIGHDVVVVVVICNIVESHDHYHHYDSISDVGHHNGY